MLGWGEYEEGVPRCAGSSAPGVELMYWWSPYLPAYISPVAEIRYYYMMIPGNELIMQTGPPLKVNYGFYFTEQLDKKCSFS